MLGKRRNQRSNQRSCYYAAKENSDLLIPLSILYYLNNSSPKKEYFCEQFPHSQFQSLTNLESVAIICVRVDSGLDQDGSGRSGTNRHLLID